MQTTIGAHLTDDVMERYALHQLSEELVPSLEEHLLLCERCQVRLEGLEDYLRAGETAAREIRNKRKVERKSSNWSSFWSLSAPAWAGAMAALLICVAVPLYYASHFNGRNAPVEVALSASRGATQTLISRAHSGNLILKIDAAELPVTPAFRVQMVNADGRDVWQGTATTDHNQLRVTIPKTLSNGQYWVRLFVPGSSDLVREFGLEVK